LALNNSNVLYSSEKQILNFDSSSNFNKIVLSLQNGFLESLQSYCGVG
jgi:hypothetical protein